MRSRPLSRWGSPPWVGHTDSKCVTLAKVKSFKMKSSPYHLTWWRLIPDESTANHRRLLKVDDEWHSTFTCPADIGPNSRALVLCKAILFMNQQPGWRTTSDMATFKQLYRSRQGDAQDSTPGTLSICSHEAISQMMAIICAARAMCRYCDEKHQSLILTIVMAVSSCHGRKVQVTRCFHQS